MHGQKKTSNFNGYLERNSINIYRRKTRFKEMVADQNKPKFYIQYTVSVCCTVF